MADKTLKNVRKSFLNYFSNKHHQIVDSSNLVPSNDPTLMFTNSGMVQFKNVFTGLEKRDYKRAVTSQKCVRAGGKHNDLENVGYTPRHHTFFEMLGNFSFGDYFKDVAIELAWNLITKEFQISKDRVSVSVYADDREAFDLWKKISGLPENRIYRIATNDNFWSMGDLGPCGPCSEIFYDHGDHLQGGPPGSKNQDGDRYIEIWNLVFMQFEQVSKDKRVNLPKPSVDTGMGLERISALLQGTHDNYEIDHFKTLIEVSSNFTKTKVTKENVASHRVIADHLRASSFLIAEGVLPSNEGRGYVLRRIMRRGMRHSHTLGSKEPIFYKMVSTLIKEMSDSYPELKRAEPLITETLKTEEEKFSSLLSRGIEILNENLNKVKNNFFPGEVAFKLYDTYGFPLDLTADILKNKNIEVDNVGFDREMEKSKKLARANWKGSGDKPLEEKWFKVREQLIPTEFLGYEFDKLEGIVLKISKGKDFVKEAKAGDKIEVATNQTPFYAESGGQIGDKGIIYSNDCKITIEDTQKKMGDLYVHYGKIEKGTLKVNQNVNLEIDVLRRNNARAYHSATHLLHEALRRTLGKHVTQKGSSVSPEKLRFDFSHNKPIEKKEIEKIEKYVNDMVNTAADVKTRIMTPKEAVEKGALAMFGEKYGDEVRVLSMGKENDGYFSTELCGGTHVKNTKDIGKFKIIDQSSIAAGVRRIEALRDKQLEAYEKLQEDKKSKQDDKISGQISSLKFQIKEYKIDPAINKDLTSVENLKNLKTQLDKIKVESILKDKTKNIIKDQAVLGADPKKNYTFRFQLLHDFPTKELRNVVDQGKKEIKHGLIVVLCSYEGKAGVAVGVTEKLTNRIDSIQIVKEISKILGGKGGGGRKDFAQAGGQNLEELKNVHDFLQKKIKTM